MSKAGTDKKSEQHKVHAISITVIVAVAILIVFELSPFGGNIRFYAKWIECGQIPVATKGSGYLNAGAAHYYESSPWPGSHPTIEYFCTRLEAELAGYSANPNTYDFPHINAQ